MALNKIRFKEKLNSTLFENRELMLNLSLKSIKAHPYAYIRMQAYALCEYKNGKIFFEENTEKERIENFFHKVMYKSYSVRFPDDYFSNEFLTNLNLKFDFINNLPENYLFLYQVHQKKIFEEYYNNLSKRKMEIFNSFQTKYKKKLKGLEYAELLKSFLKKDYDLARDGYFVKLERKVNEDIYFFIKIDTKYLDIEFTKYKRSSPTSAFIDGGLSFMGDEFIFNRIEHPLIHSIVFYNNFIQLFNLNRDFDNTFKWFFIQVNITAYFIELCFEFYESCLNVVLTDIEN